MAMTESMSEGLHSTVNLGVPLSNWECQTILVSNNFKGEESTAQITQAQEWASDFFPHNWQKYQKFEKALKYGKSQIQE